jgi:probable phosphoglycerate mutase
MVKTIHLVRHGHHTLLDHRLCGRMPGIGLDELGWQQMSRCADALTPAPTAIQSSPRQRAQQSAAILAARFGLAVKTVAAMDEIDLGDWTARTFDELSEDPDWKCWNNRRSSSRPPNGETMRSLQQRVVRHLEQLFDDESEGTLAIVSHAEPIRAALLHYSAISLDDFLSIAVEPASISTLAVDGAGIHVSKINQRVPA